jgi:hypothetical protein
VIIRFGLESAALVPFSSNVRSDQRYAQPNAARSVPTFTVLFGENKASAEMEMAAAGTCAGFSDLG